MRRLSVLLLLLGCGDKDPDTDTDTLDDTGEAVNDADGDGADTETDCDDSDASAYPGADEVCDGVDNDCDGSIDNDAVDAPTWYADSDGDGYGSPLVSAVACEAPTGHVEDGTDCDDTSAAVMPGATELCDGIDNDCDGSIDVGAADAAVFYRDGDGDGYGDATASEAACTEPSGYVSDDTDCDDASTDINPGEAEVCNDGIDNNCDDDWSSCVLEGAYVDTDADFSLTGTTYYQQVGYELSSAGDVNGDGIYDVLIGARYGGADMQGQVYVFFGSTSGLSSTPDVTASGEEESSHFGAYVDAADDIDGDGFGDFVVGAYGYGEGSTGRAYGFLGPVTAGVVPEPAFTVDASAEGDYAGWRINGVGDTNGDGYADVVVTSPANSDYVDNAGAAALFLGPVTGALALADGHAFLYGAADGDWTGGASSAPGDVNGDGFDDLCISAETATVSSSSEGEVYVVFGPVTGEVDLAADADLIIQGVEEGDTIGWGSGAGDTNGDGYADVLVSSVYRDSEAGGAWLVLGPASGTLAVTGADALIEGAAGEQVGYSVDASGDLDQDGSDDIVIGAPYAAGGDGAAYAVYGPITGTVQLSTDADITISGTAAGRLGRSVAILSDVHNDGYDELGVGAYLDSSASTYNGAAYVFFGLGL